MSQIVCLCQEDLLEARPLIDNYPFLPYRQIEGLSKETLSEFLLAELRDILTNGYVGVFKEAGGLKGIVSLKELPWDSNVFGLQMGRIAHLIGPSDYKESLSICNLLLAFILQVSKEKGIRHLYLRVDTDDLALIHSVEEIGFRLMDSIVISIFDLSWPLKGMSNQGIVIRAHQEGDLERVSQMANGLFNFGRFHTDPNLSDEKCNELYLKWIERDFQGYADTILVSEIDGVVNGFVICLIDRDFELYFKKRLGVIDLVGVSRQAQGRGVGSLLLNSALKWFKEERVDLVKAGTMIKNYQAIRVYQKTGFKIVGTNFSFHKWIGWED